MWSYVQKQNISLFSEQGVVCIVNMESRATEMIYVWRAVKCSLSQRRRTEKTKAFNSYEAALTDIDSEYSMTS